jgi:hypothetical protein
MTTLRTHFTFRVDTWTPDGESIVEPRRRASRTIRLHLVAGSSENNLIARAGEVIE